MDCTEHVQLESSDAPLKHQKAHGDKAILHHCLPCGVIMCSAKTLEEHKRIHANITILNYPHLHTFRFPWYTLDLKDGKTPKNDTLQFVYSREPEPWSRGNDVSVTITKDGDVSWQPLLLLAYPLQESLQIGDSRRIQRIRDAATKRLKVLGMDTKFIRRVYKKTTPAVREP
ncbi:hypothetical protein K491DRAFT_15801 [Lophiostoma macrostomum CBS 122681]|uniref:C2H2-type domain-containing protein n=1 Tax=Lophiostoma macrostomum CBS 122681 TaxID=1314788 RepID=A0A6A6TNJ2_9PLEO|nr:hypothetical protein K491DRAFT_15801 [Lophiostoma macrostomum CBS 122681]